MHCLLCGGISPRKFEVPGTTQKNPIALFWHCTECDFIAKDVHSHLSAKDEQARYETHNNGTEGHLRFLNPVVEAVQELMPSHSKGLDWGSGPVPVLAQALSENSFEMEIYDPFFATQSFQPDRLAQVGSRPFDFITLTEVIEHFYDPKKELKQISSLLKSGGKFFVMTESPPKGDDLVEIFKNWHYRRDPTHVGFFSERCFSNFEKMFGLKMIKSEKRLFIFEKI